jgi:outer membrane protein
MLKKIVISLFTIFALSNFALADNHNNGIATVNVDKVKMETKAGKSIADQLIALQTNFKDKVAKLQKDFDAKKQELDKQKNVLSKEAFAKKEEDFNYKVNESRNDIQKEASDIEGMQQIALSEFNSIALEVITNLAKEGKYLQIFPTELMIYADSKVDITSQVIAGIDKKSTNIVVKAPEIKKPAKK